MSSDSTPTGTRATQESYGTCVTLSCQDMFAYADYKKLCKTSKATPKPFSVWIKETYNVTLLKEQQQTKVVKAIDKGLG